jgi:hypothetical protein
MCVICRGLKNNKMSLQEATEKYEEFLELDLLDEDHQEEVEELIAEAESELSYWDNKLDQSAYDGLENFDEEAADEDLSIYEDLESSESDD